MIHIRHGLMAINWLISGRNVSPWSILVEIGNVRHSGKGNREYKREYKNIRGNREYKNILITLGDLL